jgi:rhomboid protease GluP
VNDQVSKSPVQRTSPRRQIDFTQFPGAYSLIALTVIIFIGQLTSDFLIQPDWLLQLGAKSRGAIAAGQYWRFITPIFLHIGALHLFVNMYSLYAIGPAVERFFGTPRFLAQYFLSGFAGVLFSIIFSPFPSAGASGAIFGLLGSLGAFLYVHRDLFGQFGRLQLRQIVLVALLNLGLGLMPGIDNWGHLGGLLTGALLAFLLGPRLEIVWLGPDERQVRDNRPWAALRWSYFLVAVILIMFAIATQFFPSITTLT